MEIVPLNPAAENMECIMLSDFGFVSATTLAYRSSLFGRIVRHSPGLPMATAKKMRVAVVSDAANSKKTLAQALSFPDHSNVPVYELQPPAEAVPRLITLTLFCLVLLSFSYSTLIGLGLPLILQTKAFGGEYERLSAANYMRLQMMTSDTSYRRDKPEDFPLPSRLSSVLERKP
ncbi:hypothetical protein FHT76_000838 [Rhizobium sp. BK176]|nr:hypothetical protein [Rhizobium sp. BK176]